MAGLFTKNCVLHHLWPKLSGVSVLKKSYWQYCVTSSCAHVVALLSCANYTYCIIINSYLLSVWQQQWRSASFSSDLYLEHCELKCDIISSSEFQLSLNLTRLLLTLPGMGLPAILALAISELVLRGTLRLAIPPSSSELERWPWPRSRSAALPWPWLWRAQTRWLKLTLYLGNQYILYRRQRVTYTVLKPRWATHTILISLRHTRCMNHTHVVGKETNTKQEQKCKKKTYAASNNAHGALFLKDNK